MHRAIVALLVVLHVTPSQAQRCESAATVIEAVYRQILGRSAIGDPGSVVGVNKLAGGMPTKELIRWAVAQGAEWRAKYFSGRTTADVVTTLYSQLLNRTPDPTGMNTWSSVIVANGLPAAVDGILGSVEYNTLSGDWGVPSPGGAKIRACIHHADVRCGTINVTSAEAFCDATREHAECRCDHAVASWPKCTCDAGPPPPSTPLVGGAPKVPLPNGAHTPDRGKASLSIHNYAWNNANIQIRVGNATDPENNPWYAGGSFSLKKDTVLVVHTSGEDVFVRRESDPDHPNGQWGAWLHIGLVNDEHKETNL